MAMANSNVDQLEEAVSQAERDLEPSKIRKVFTSFGFGVSCGILLFVCTCGLI